MPSTQQVHRTGHFRAQVVAVQDLSPTMRRITLDAAELASVSWPVGCDVAIVLTGADGRELRRRYTVRRASGSTITVDAFLHGHGPGSTWAATLDASAGTDAGARLAPVEVELIGPRSELPTPPAEWLLALTDESGLPAIAVVCENTSAPMVVFAEIAETSAEHERYPITDRANVDVHWLIRRETAADGTAPSGAGGTALFRAALADFTLPDGTGVGYVLGESRAVIELRDLLVDKGLPRGNLHAKGYWNQHARATR